MADPNVWMYVSRSALGPMAGESAVSDIVRQSREYNATHGVTGMLLFTGALFAQLIEGPAEAIEALKRSISADARHRDLVTLSPEPQVGRRFAQWSLGYSGPSHFVRAAVEQTLKYSGREQSARTEELARLMMEFAA